MEANLLLGRIAASLQSRGVAATARLAAARLRGRVEDWSERRLDRRYGTDTAGTSRKAVPEGFEGRPYEPVTPWSFRRTIRAAHLDPRRYTFVDYGSGKGRAVLLAAELGFRRSIGVELQPSLHEIALSNGRAFRRARPTAGRIEFVLGDATAYRPPADEDAVLFFYNPFGEALMERTLATLAEVQRAAPRRRIIAYRNPVHAAVLERSRGLECLAKNRSFALYSLTAPVIPET
jgi:SAM-dependent methyltransferase